MKSMQFWLKLLGSSLLTSIVILGTVSCKNSSSSSTSKPDISSGVTVTVPSITAVTYESYEELNNNKLLLNTVTVAINTAKNLSVLAGVDFVLTNDHTGRQVAGVLVTFIVTAIGSQITGSFSFKITLDTPDISSGVFITDLHTPTDPSKPYSSLNSDTRITNAITSAINTSKYVNVQSGIDYIVSNNQTGNQVPGTIVTFTVTAISSQIKGSFNFNDTLGQIDISNGVTVENPRTAADPYSTYADLNSNKTILQAVADAIYVAKLIKVKPNIDFTLSNNQNPFDLQTADIVVIFIVTATGSTISGSFTFNNTLTRISISNGVTIKDLKTPADPNNNFGALNSNPDIIVAIQDAILNAKAISAVVNIDFIISNNQTSANKQVIGSVVTFTVTAIGSQITGSFRFTDTLGRIDVTNGVSVEDLKSPTDTNSTFESLNTNAFITSAVATAINASKGVSVSPDIDFYLTNNLTGFQIPGAVVVFTVNSISSSKVMVGSFNFVDTLSKISIASGIKVADPKTVADPTATYGDLNTNPDIINLVTDAIYNAKNIIVEFGTDFVIKNSRPSAAYQVPGTVVTFIVSSLTTSTKISGVFSFTNTLSKAS